MKLTIENNITGPIVIYFYFNNSSDFDEVRVVKSLESHHGCLQDYFQGVLVGGKDPKK